MIQLGSVIIAARLRLKRVSLALALLYTAEQHDFPSGPTIQLGAVIIAARLRLGCGILALALLHTYGTPRVTTLSSRPAYSCTTRVSQSP